MKNFGVEIRPEQFELQRHRQFGRANPERMDLPYWEWMVRSELNAYQALRRFGAQPKVKAGPDWCFTRSGMSSTVLPDGRTVFVGGEFEDEYDEEFCIYNDVIVRGPADEVVIFGYPREVFSPTDFHTATLIGKCIILVGCFGYEDDRRLGQIPVFALDTVSYRVERINTTGEIPGWLFEHSAEFDSERGTILVRSGQVIVAGADGKHTCRSNFDEYALDMSSLQWSQVTRLNWHQYRVRFFDHSGKRIFPQHEIELGQLLPAQIKSEQRSDSTWHINVDGVPITLRDNAFEIDAVVEGDLPDVLVLAVLNELAVNLESQHNFICRVEALS
jgi:hypothetical protein